MAIYDVSERSIADLISLTGKVAVVTGAARGIGYAIADRLTEAGATVIITDIAKAAADNAAQQIQLRRDGKVSALHLDVCDSAAIKAAVARIVQDFGQIDIWVNNAGAYPSAAALEISDEEWDHLLNLNLRSLFICARESARHMVDAGRGGVIINLASTAAVKTGGGNAAHYVSSKHAVAGLTKSLAFELGPHNIRVLALAPTLCYTPGVAEKRTWLDSFGMGSVLDEYAAKLPLGRAAQPDDVARVALFCASDLATYMTGSMLFADGGDMVG